jgi:hypothetical protein
LSWRPASQPLVPHAQLKVKTMGWGSVLVSQPVIDQINRDPDLSVRMQIESLGQWDHDGVFFARVTSPLITVDGSHYDLGIEDGQPVFRRADEFTPEFERAGRA